MSGDKGNGPVKRPRVIGRTWEVSPGPLKDLKDLLYKLYLEAGPPSLDEIHAVVEEQGTESVAGWPGRDSIRRIIGEPTMPPSQADVVAVARALVRLARWDADDVASRVRELWVQAWMTVPVGVPITQVTDAFALEVHRSIDAGAPGLPELPVYVRRGHDEGLARVVKAAVDGRSQVAVLVGGSSTGKTRACWEALSLLRERPEPWRLWHPIDPTRPDAALADLGRIGRYTVVWLNEAQFYLADPDLGERVAARMRTVLRDPARAPVLVLATLWPAHWNTLTTRPDSEPDRHPDARALLNGHEIWVREEFSDTDLEALAARAGGDPRLSQAAELAGDGQITQYLAGVPVLMDRYQQAPPATKALIWAAMDARRLGCGPRLPLALLAGAAPGYLTDRQWEQTSEDWLQHALDYITTPCNGIPGILIPVKNTAARNRRQRAADPYVRGGPEPGPLYRLADYLDQHGRTHRTDQIPPIDFWTAAATHAHPAELNTLGDAAWYRGLYRDAAQLYKHAITHGDPRAVLALIHLMEVVHPTDRRPAHWAVAHMRLDNQDIVPHLLAHLRQARDTEGVEILLARNPAAHIALDDPDRLAALLDSLWRAGEREQVDVLLGRNPAAHVALDDPDRLARLLDNLRRVGATQQVEVLLARSPVDHIDDADPFTVARLLGGLWKAGDTEGAEVLLARDPAAHVDLHDTDGVVWLLEKLREAEEIEQFNALAHRAVAQLALSDSMATNHLLAWLRRLGATEQADALLARNPAAHIALDDAFAVAGLLEELREAGATEQVEILLARDPAAHIIQYNVVPVAKLLKDLQAGATEQVTVLADRVGAHLVCIAEQKPDREGWLVDRLREAGAAEQVTALTARLPAVGEFGLYRKIDDHEVRFRFGREPDTAPAASWAWEDLE